MKCEGREVWETRVKAQIASGLNQSEWCRQNKISTKSLSRWKTKLSQKPMPPGAWTQVQKPLTPIRQSRLTLHYADLRLEIPNDFDPQFLQTLLEVLKACSL